jgi:hypothetical protein
VAPGARPDATETLQADITVSTAAIAARVPTQQGSSRCPDPEEEAVRSTYTAESAGRDLEEAVAVLWRELDTTITLAMHLADLADVMAEGGSRINSVKLRRDVARKLRASVEARDRVLAPFGIDGGLDADQEASS